MKRKIILLVFGVLIVSSIIWISLCNKDENGVILTQLKCITPRQMMGYILVTENKKVIVIDGGSSFEAENLYNHITELGGTVDCWFITHPHDDHIGAFVKLIKERANININKLYYTMNDFEWYEANEQREIQDVKDFIEVLNSEKVKDISYEVSLGEKIKIDNIKCEILGIKNPEITGNAINNSSMVIKMNVYGKKILFLADTGIHSATKLLENQRENLKADIVQMAHHGQNGGSEELYKTIKPSICLWPTSEAIWNNDNGNGYNSGPWTTLTTRRWCEEMNVETNIVEKDGDISLLIRKNEITVLP